LKPLRADEQEESPRARPPLSGLPSAITVETKLDTDSWTNVARTAMVPVLGRTHRTAAVIPRRANRPGRWTIPSLLIASVVVMTLAAVAAITAVAVTAVAVTAVAVTAVAAITAVIIASLSRSGEGSDREHCNDNGEYSFHDSRWIWIGFK
jgi:hypothetical protein